MAPALPRVQINAAAPLRGCGCADLAPAARLHGKLNPGAVVVAKAAALAVEKAAAHGFGASRAAAYESAAVACAHKLYRAGVVGTHGTASSSMALGFYAKQARAARRERHPAAADTWRAFTRRLRSAA